MRRFKEGMDHAQWVKDETASRTIVGHAQRRVLELAAVVAEEYVTITTPDEEPEHLEEMVQAVKAMDEAMLDYNALYDRYHE